MSIAGDDYISRCITFAKSFNLSIHTDEYLFVFGQSGEDKASHESGVLRSLAPSDNEVHVIGCGIAQKQNERAKEPERGPKRKYYCGFRTAKIEDLPLIEEGRYEIKLSLDGKGSAAHVDVALLVHSDDKSERNLIKAEAGIAMAEVFGPATEHVCECDVGDKFHPLSIDPTCLQKGLPNYREP